MSLNSPQVFQNNLLMFASLYLAFNQSGSWIINTDGGRRNALCLCKSLGKRGKKDFSSLIPAPYLSSQTPISVTFLKIYEPDS